MKTIQLSGICLYDCMPPLSTVTTLHIHGDSETLSLPYTRFCAIFGSLPALTHLFLYDYPVELPADTASSVLFPSLSSLHILSAEGANSDPMLLAILLAPKLEQLFVERLCDDMEVLAQRAGWSITSPRYPSLTSLTLRLSEALQPSTWRFIEQSFATVTSLTVFHAEMEDLSEVLNGLSSNISSPTDVPWPRLQILSWGVVFDPE